MVPGSRPRGDLVLVLDLEETWYLVLNMRAGSMLTEAMRPTCRISLAIILIFSKLMRPSTLESFPEEVRSSRR